MSFFITVLIITSKIFHKFYIASCENIVISYKLPLNINISNLKYYQSTGWIIHLYFRELGFELHLH